MPRFTVLILFLLVLISPAGPASGTTWLNLGFEDGVAGGSPMGWYAGGRGYQGTLSEDAPHGGELCLELKWIEAQENGFGVATSTFPAADAAGHSIRFSGWIRTEDVGQGYAGLWWRADGENRELLAFDNMTDRGVTGTTPWSQHTIELEIPAKTVNINFGCILPGRGKAWFDDLEVFIDDVPYEQIRPEPMVLNEEQLAWLVKTSHPFATDDPTHDNSDLAFVRDLVGDARIVALGEGTHGTAEFFRMKHRLLRYLAEEMGFTLFAIEASMPEAELLNDYVLHGHGDPARLIAGMYFWTWNTHEVLAMVEWMRQHNLNGGHVEFHGVDMQSPGNAMLNVLRGLQEHAPDLQDHADTTYRALRALMETARQAGSYQLDISNQLMSHVAAIGSGLTQRRGELEKTLGKDQTAWLLQNSRLVEQYCEMAGDHAVNKRDLFMAENTDWLLEQAGPEAKIVLWAHNAHVSRSGWGTGESQGQHLASRHGRDMVVFGFCFHQGTYTAMKQNAGLGAWGTSDSRPGSVEWAFQQTGRPRLMLDLRQARKGSPESGWLHEEMDHRSIGAMAMDEAFFPGVVSEKYDVLIYLQDSTPSVQTGVARPGQWDNWD